MRTLLGCGREGRMTLAQRERDRRFHQIADEMRKRGFYLRVYIHDVNGVRHYIEPSALKGRCGAEIHPQARIAYDSFPTCVRCVQLPWPPPLP